MGLSRTVSRINGDIGRKSQNFLTPSISRPSWKGSPWIWAPALGSKTRMTGLPGRERSLTISSAVSIQSTNVTDRRRDRRTDTRRQQRPSLRIASRGKNCKYHFARIRDTWTQLSLTNRATRLEVIQRHQTWYHSFVTYGFLLVYYSNFVHNTHRYSDIWLEKMS